MPNPFSRAPAHMGEPLALLGPPLLDPARDWLRSTSRDKVLAELSCNPWEDGERAGWSISWSDGRTSSRRHVLTLRQGRQDCFPSLPEPQSPIAASGLLDRKIRTPVGSSRWHSCFGYVMRAEMDNKSLRLVMVRGFQDHDSRTPTKLSFPGRAEP